MANGVYWVGQDGKTYIRTEGMANAEQWHAPMLSPTQQGLQEIRDPALPAPSSPAPTGGTSGGGGAVNPPLNQGAVTNTQLTIDQLPALLAAALDTEDLRFQNTVGELGAQETGQRKVYGESTTTNQQNYDSSFMDSIRAGIKGLGGLMALLRGTGAAGGSVDDQVRDTVGGVTAADIRAGADTQKENQTSLDNSLSSFLGELGRKRRANNDAYENNKRGLYRDTDTQLQDLYGKMAGFYGDAGRTAEANSWMARAGALTPNIAGNSRTALSPYDTTPVVVEAPKITAFAEPTQPSVLAAPSDGQVGSGIFTMSDRRRKEPALAGA